MCWREAFARRRNRIRVTGQLIDTLTGNHIWAERYDRVLEDIFAVQEEVTQSHRRPRSRRRSSWRSNRRPLDAVPTISAPTKSLFGRGPMRWKGHGKADRTLLDQSIREAGTRWQSTRAACWRCKHLRVLTGLFLYLQMAADREHAYGKPTWRPRGQSNWTVRMRSATPCEASAFIWRGQWIAIPMRSRMHAAPIEMNPNDTFVLRLLGSGSCDR